MIFGLIILATALLLSAVAAWYSIAGLVAIFSAAAIPVIIMGASLELGKIVATVWLHNNWRRAPLPFKLYLVPAVAFLMLLTSMGIFGFLSKAHLDQNIISGDSYAQIALIDERIANERDTISNARTLLGQLDRAVADLSAAPDQEIRQRDGSTQVRSSAERALQVRRQQANDRAALTKTIEQAQARIVTLQEQKAPLAAEFRKIEAEVGPIKYIAALIYGDQTDQNTLERAVRYVIIMIVIVFDPLALTLILAGNKQLEWARRGQGGWTHEDPPPAPIKDPPSPPDAEPVDPDTKTDSVPIMESGPPWARYFLKNWENITDTKPPATVTPPDNQNIAAVDADDPVEHENLSVKAAMKKWKEANPDNTLKEQRRRLARGEIDELPWMTLVADNTMARPVNTGFGTKFPSDAQRGDTFVRVDQLPNQLFRFNGANWIEIDKTTTDVYTYDDAYIDHLIEQIGQGQYDPEFLSESEKIQIEARLQQRDNGQSNTQ